MEKIYSLSEINNLRKLLNASDFNSFLISSHITNQEQLANTLQTINILNIFEKVGLVNPDNITIFSNYNGYPQPETYILNVNNDEQCYFSIAPNQKDGFNIYGYAYHETDNKSGATGLVYNYPTLVNFLDDKRVQEKIKNTLINQDNMQLSLSEILYREHDEDFNYEKMIVSGIQQHSAIGIKKIKEALPILQEMVNMNLIDGNQVTVRVSPFQDYQVQIMDFNQTNYRDIRQQTHKFSINCDYTKGFSIIEYQFNKKNKQMEETGVSYYFENVNQLMNHRLCDKLLNPSVNDSQKPKLKR